MATMTLRREFRWEDLDHDSMDDFMLNDYDVVYSEKCKLCAKLDVAYAERSPIRLKDHMKMK